MTRSKLSKLSKPTKLSPGERVAGAVAAGVVGGVWSFLRVWLGSVNFFNKIADGLGVVGILVGWIPGVPGAAVGLVYGAVEGNKLGGMAGVKASVAGINQYVERVENKGFTSKTLSQAIAPIDWKSVRMIFRKPSSSRTLSSLSSKSAAIKRKRPTSSKDKVSNGKKFKANQNIFLTTAHSASKKLATLFSTNGVAQQTKEKRPAARSR